MFIEPESRRGTQYRTYPSLLHIQGCIVDTFKTFGHVTEEW